MAPSPIPAPLPPWARALLQVAPLIPTGLQFALEYIEEMFSSDSPTPGQWRHVQIVFEHVGNTEPKDRYVTGLDIANITNGSIDNSWTDADYTVVQGQLDTLIGAFRTHMATTMKCLEVRYYVRQFNPLTLATPYPPSGPPERIYPMGQAGLVAGTVNVPPQIAHTHTERTAYPRHWGRSYWPGLAATKYLATGQLDAATTTALGTAVDSAYTTLQNQEFFPVVPVTQIDKAPARGLLTVDKIAVDDIPDVIRRRRPSVGITKYVSAG